MQEGYLKYARANLHVHRSVTLGALNFYELLFLGDYR